MNLRGLTSALIAFGLSALGIGLSLAFTTESQLPSTRIGKHTPVAKVMRELGAAPRLHRVSGLDTNLVRKGGELITQGYTVKPNGQKTKRISKFYQCTHCHNVRKENPDLSNINPEARLSYAMEHNLPFNQGTTLYGVVNRESWYNGDYVEKYGKAALKARDTLTKAIQLCATECAQGRRLTAWEMKAVLHYLWSRQLKMGDLGLSDRTMARVKARVAGNRESPKLIEKLKDQFYTASPATFLDALPVSERRMGKGGNPARGKAIYKHSCRTCHKAGGPTRYTLDYSVLTFNQLVRHFDDYSEKSIYQVLRYGTSPKKGYRPYMPHYPKERMSRKQVNDLAAYIRKQASIDLP